MNRTKILLVGCGKMGSALLEGWLGCGIAPADIYVVEPGAVENLQKLKVNIYPDHKGLPADLDICLFAVKPQNFDEVVANYKFIDATKCIFISIAAGKTIDKMQSLLGTGAKIIRAMPNLPATVSAGVTAIFCNKNVSASEKGRVTELLKCVGDVVEVSAEDQMDVVTAISGSGPAYIFHLIESLSEIGKRSGLDEKVALTLAKNTVYGSGKLAMQSAKGPEQLRIDVTSKGGTTEAALKPLMDDKKLENLLQTAIKAAIARAKELQ